MMMTGEVDDQGVAAQRLELGCGYLPVVTIETHPSGERQPEPNQ